jgi:hypothetical protein
MSAQLAQKGRTPFAIADRMAGTAEEIKAAFESYQTCYGRYKIDEREHVVTHTVIHSLMPNLVGTAQRRQYRFKDGRVIQRTRPILIGGRRLTGELVWEKKSGRAKSEQGIMGAGSAGAASIWPLVNRGRAEADT